MKILFCLVIICLFTIACQTMVVETQPIRYVTNIVTNIYPYGEEPQTNIKWKVDIMPMYRVSLPLIWDRDF